MEWNEQKFDGVVFPPDNTSSPYTVVHMGHGLVEVGVVERNGIYGLWLGKASGPGEIGRVISEGKLEGSEEGLVSITFSNVESLDVVLEILSRVRQRILGVEE